MVVHTAWETGTALLYDPIAAQTHRTELYGTELEPYKPVRVAMYLVIFRLCGTVRNCMEQYGTVRNNTCVLDAVGRVMTGCALGHACRRRVKEHLCRKHNNVSAHGFLSELKPARSVFRAHGVLSDLVVYFFVARA